VRPKQPLTLSGFLPLCCTPGGDAGCAVGWCMGRAAHSSVFCTASVWGGVGAGNATDAPPNLAGRCTAQSSGQIGFQRALSPVCLALRNEIKVFHASPTVLINIRVPFIHQRSQGDPACPAGCAALLLWLLQAVSMGGFGGALQLSVLTMAVADSLTALPVLSVPMLSVTSSELRKYIVCCMLPLLFAPLSPK